MHADTEHFLKRVNSYEDEHTMKYQEHIPNPIIFKGKDCINKFITWVLDKQKWTKQIATQYFNKRLIMTSEDEKIYNNSHR